MRVFFVSGREKRIMEVVWNRLKPIAVLSVVLLAGCFSDIEQGSGGGAESLANTPRFAYVANYSDDSVSTYVVDDATGRLKFIGKAAAGTQPFSVTVDPTGGKPEGRPPEIKCTRLPSTRLMPVTWYSCPPEVSVPESVGWPPPPV